MSTNDLLLVSVADEGPVAFAPSNVAVHRSDEDHDHTSIWGDDVDPDAWMDAYDEDLDLYDNGEALVTRHDDEDPCCVCESCVDKSWDIWESEDAQRLREDAELERELAMEFERLDIGPEDYGLVDLGSFRWVNQADIDQRHKRHDRSGSPKTTGARRHYYCRRHLKMEPSWKRQSRRRRQWLPTDQVGAHVFMHVSVQDLPVPSELSLRERKPLKHEREQTQRDAWVQIKRQRQYLWLWQMGCFLDDPPVMDTMTDHEAAVYEREWQDQVNAWEADIQDESWMDAYHEDLYPGQELEHPWGFWPFWG